MNSLVHSKYKPSKMVIATTLIVLMLTAIALPLIPLASAVVTGVTVTSITTDPSPLVAGFGGVVTIQFTVTTNDTGKLSFTVFTDDGENSGWQSVTLSNPAYDGQVEITIPADVPSGLYSVSVMAVQKNQKVASVSNAFEIVSNSPTPTPTAIPAETTAPVASNVVITPADASIPLGAKLTYTATAQDTSGNNHWDVTNDLTGFSSNAGDFNGATLTATTVGPSQTVTGIYNSQPYTTTVTVLPHGEAHSISVTTGSSSITAGQSATYTATATDIYGNQWTDTSVTWRIDSSAGGSWNGNVYTSAKAGSWTVTATDGVSGSSSLTVTPAALSTVMIAPSGVSLAVDATQTYTATASDIYGNTWDVTSGTTFNSAAGTFSSATLTAQHDGTSQTVTGTYGSTDYTTTVTVSGYGPVDSLSLNVGSSTIAADGSQTYVATAKDVYGNTWTVDASYSDESSTLSNPVVEHTVGSYTIIASYGGKTATASLVVTHGSVDQISISPTSASIVAGGSQSYSATASDKFGNTWAVDASYKVNGNQITGSTVTETKVGSYTVLATYNDKTTSTTLSVTPVGLAKVVVGVSSDNIVAGSVVTLTAEGYDQYGNDLGLQSVTFTVNGKSVSGTSVTETAVGSYTVSVTTSGVTVTTTGFTVTHAGLDHVAIAPSDVSLGFGATQVYSATAYDSYGNSWDVTSDTKFTSGAGSFSGATLTAQKDGASQTVTGTYNSVAYTATVTVTGHGAVASLSVSTGSSSIVAGQSATFTALATDSFGNQWIDTSVTWSADSGAAGSWNGNVYTPAKAGSWTVTAKDGSVTGTTSLTINAGSLASLTLSGPASVTSAGTATFTATGFDAQGNSLGTQTASWSISSGAAGSWSGNVYTSGNAGSWTVTATVGSVTGTALLKVNAGPLASLTVSGPASVTSAGTATFTATGFDAQGNSLGTQTASWSISSGAAGSWSGNVYTSGNAGSWTVTAKVGSVTGITSLTVSQPSPTITPTPTPTAKPMDTTGPTITHTITGTLGNNGWYTSEVKVVFTATDGESKITSQGLTSPTRSCGNTYTVTCDTSGVTITYTATSAGGTSSDSVTIKKDATKPWICGSTSPLPNCNGWNNQDVTVSFSACDTLSGVASVTSPVTLSKESAGQTVTGTAVDKAGNTATFIVKNINIDKTKPTITINVPTNVVLNQPATGTWTASDALSGIDCTTDGSQCSQGMWWLYSCSSCYQYDWSCWNQLFGKCSDFDGTSDPTTFTIHTCTAGVKTGVITVTDEAGNTATQTWTTNVNYKFGGFLSPLPNSSNKAGSTIPVKFQILDYYNKPITCLSAVDSITANGIDATATGNTALRCDSNQYVFNLSTKGMHTGPLTIAVTLADGNTYSTTTTLK